MFVEEFWRATKENDEDEPGPIVGVPLVPETALRCLQQLPGAALSKDATTPEKKKRKLQAEKEGAFGKWSWKRPHGRRSIGKKPGHDEHCVILSGAVSAKEMKRFDEVVHQRELAQGKLVTILASLENNSELTWATLKTCQKEVEVAYDAYHTAYGQILGMVPSTSRDEQDALYDAFDDLHTEVLTVIEEKLPEVSQPTRRRNAYTPGVPQWVDETTNPTTVKIVGCANEAAIDEPQKRSGKLLSEQLDTEDRVRPECTIPHGERSENNHKIEKPKTIIDTCKIADEDSSHPTKKPPGQNATDDPGQQKMVLTAGSEPAQKCDVCGLGQHKSWKCPQFLEKTVPERLFKTKEKSLCFNCLRTGHTPAQCVSIGACATCKKRHHTLLHAECRRNPKQPTTQTKVEQPGAPQQADTSPVTPEASSSGQGQLAPDALSAVADSRNKPCSPHPCSCLLITTQHELDRHHANELADIEEQSRSNTMAIPAGVQLAVRVNLVALRETSFSQVLDSTIGSGAAHEEAVLIQGTEFEDQPNLEQHTEACAREVGETYKETSLVSDQTAQGRFYLLFQAMLRTSKTTLAFQAERFQGGETRCSARLQSTLLTAARTSTPHKAAAVGTQLRFDERSKHRATAAPVIMKKTKSGSGRTHPHQRSVCADPLTKRTFGAAEDRPSGSETRCRFPTIGKQQEALKFILQVVQSFWQPLRLSTAPVRNNTTCKYYTKLSNGMTQVRSWSKPKKPPEETTQDLPDTFGQQTGAGMTRRRKCDLWIAWRSLAVLRGWRMFEPEPVSSKKILVWFWQHCACCDDNCHEGGNPACVVANSEKDARNDVCSAASETELATARRRRRREGIARNDVRGKNAPLTTA
ncbi:uncharacterized protein LOC120426715 [Culex pipiens pallens]|uniref:uncharacterized protein LOC120426715 n=1 Tax=Culex pipiens pallens TaxID=42434 RepID=UPI0022AAE877|nr:uncharacterized protein LOC120426715 [Culex pipiens pallens]